jgi:3-methyl-2-oxobutanoate hydroxymethyltransferase
VGDSLGYQVQGKKDTLSVTIDDMIYHSHGVARAPKRALVVTGMPFMSHEINTDKAKRNAGRIITEEVQIP